VVDSQRTATAKRAGEPAGPAEISGAAGKSENALAAGRINGESRGSLPLLAAPAICAGSPDANGPVSCVMLTCHGRLQWAVHVTGQKKLPGGRRPGII
jgi:hypothetical protein